MDSSIVIKVDKSKSVLVTPTQLPESCTEFQWDGTILTGEDEKCQFVGRKADGASSTAERWCVGVLGDDGVLTVHPAQPITLRQRVTAYEEQVSSLKGVGEQYRALFEDFGSAKKRKVLKSQEANRLGGNEKSAPTPAAQPAGPSAVEQATNEWRKTFLPEWNADASIPRDVYDASKMAGTSAWSVVNRLAEGSFQSERMKPSIEALLAKNGISSNQKSCLLLCHFFTDLYERFSRRPIPPIDYERGSFYGQPLAVAERFLEKFSSQGTGVKLAMSKGNRDSCLVHIFLLYMLACHPKKMESKTIRTFVTELRLESASVVHLLRQAGVKITVDRSKQTIDAKLMLPLTFPSLKKKPPSRK